MNSKILIALFVVGIIAAVMAQHDPKNSESAEASGVQQPERFERDASSEMEAETSSRVKRQWGYGYPMYGYGYRPWGYRPWGYRRWGYGGFYG